MDGNRAPYGEEVDTLVDDTDGPHRYLLEYHHDDPSGHPWYFVAVTRNGEWLHSAAFRTNGEAVRRLQGYRNEIARTDDDS